MILPGGAGWRSTGGGIGRRRGREIQDKQGRAECRSVPKEDGFRGLCRTATEPETGGDKETGPEVRGVAGWKPTLREPGEKSEGGGRLDDQRVEPAFGLSAWSDRSFR